MSRSKFEILFKNTNFGTDDYDSLVLKGLEMVCLGYSNGGTLDKILLNAQLIEKRDFGGRALTDDGLIEMYALKQKAAL